MDSGFTVLSLPGQAENQEVTNESPTEGTHQTAKDNNDEITLFNMWYMYWHWVFLNMLNTENLIYYASEADINSRDKLQYEWC